MNNSHNIKVTKTVVNNSNIDDAARSVFNRNQIKYGSSNNNINKREIIGQKNNVNSNMNVNNFSSNNNSINNTNNTNNNNNK